MQQAQPLKTKTLADGLIERTSSMLDETGSKTLHKHEEGDVRGKRNKTLSEEEPF